MGMWAVGGTTLRFCLMKSPDDVLFEQPSRDVSGDVSGEGVNTRHWCPCSCITLDNPMFYTMQIV